MAILNYEFNNLNELFVHELKDLYDAEHQIAEALPLMAEAASSPDLKQAFQMHQRETEQQIKRLEQVFSAIGTEPERETCKAIKGIISEGQDILKARGDDDVRDAGLIAAAQRVEHYEMAGYGTVRTFARQLGLNDVAQTLQQTLDEEGNTDKKLTTLAERGINRRAEA